jgi:hypothetical protein
MFQFFRFLSLISALPSLPPASLSEHSLFPLWPSTLLHHSSLWCSDPPRVKEHHLDLGGLYFYSNITCTAILYIYIYIYGGLHNGLIDFNTMGIRQGNIKYTPKIRPIAPLFMTNVACIVLFCFFTLWLLVSFTSNSLTWEYMSWCNKADLWVGAWDKVWLCGGPKDGSLTTFSAWEKLSKGQPKRVQVCRGEQGVSHVWPSSVCRQVSFWSN